MLSDTNPAKQSYTIARISNMICLCDSIAVVLGLLMMPQAFVGCEISWVGTCSCMKAKTLVRWRRIKSHDGAESWSWVVLGSTEIDIDAVGLYVARARVPGSIRPKVELLVDNSQYRGARLVSLVLGSSGCCLHKSSTMSHIMGYDLEYPCYPGVFCPPWGPIVSLAVDCSCGRQKFWYNVRYTAFGTNTHADAVGLLNSNMIADCFIEFVLEHMPSWIVGHNSWGYDNERIMHHASPKYQRYMFYTKYETHFGWLLNFPGVYSADTMYLGARTGGQKYSGTSLREMCERNSIGTKLDFPTEMGDGTVLMEYNLEDARLCRKLFTVCNLAQMLAWADVARGWITDCVRYVTGTLFASAVSSYSLNAGYILEYGSEVHRTVVQGGMVWEPLVGQHNGVVIYDFKSLYPSIMMHCNISPELAIECDEVPMEYGDVMFDDHHVYVCASTKVKFDTRVPGVMLGALAPLWRMKDEAALRTDIDQGTVDALVLSTKNLINSSYGILASPHSAFGASSCAAAITCLARYVTGLLVSAIREYGGTVVYGDTDSAFATSVSDPQGPIDLFYRYVEGTPLAKLVIKIEHVGLAMVITAKKNYALRMVDGSIKYKGMGVSSKATSPLIVGLVKTLVGDVLSQGTATTYVDKFNEWAAGLCDMQLNGVPEEEMR
eukprot:GHVU01040869.1.p1 GENE.GHVU01040869.1~~GHVU01040869.1.p1  ORF type:complete len:663 (-),score=22.54 GHVU01040869.1:65-2053(-)